MCSNNNNLLFILRKYPFVYDQMRLKSVIKSYFMQLFYFKIFLSGSTPQHVGVSVA
jgi:hypothetical protein